MDRIGLFISGFDYLSRSNIFSMKKSGFVLFFLNIGFLFLSCTKHEESYPRITFKTNAGYQLGGGSLPPNTSYVLGVNLKSSLAGYANKTFTVTRSYNGGPDSVIFTKELSGTEVDNYSYEIKTKSDSVWGNYYRYTFSAVNEKSYTNQIQAKISTGG